MNEATQPRTASETDRAPHTDRGRFRAHNGFELPTIGLGTYALRGAAGAASAQRAIEAGYRLLDSAMNYENEGAIGHAVRNSPMPRAEITYTSKLPGRHHSTDTVLFSIEESLMRSGLDAIDLHLVHWPNPQTGLYVEAWQGLVAAQQRGLVRQIGVSNFLPEHLERIEGETGVRPVVNQIEVHPFFPQNEAIAYHAERGIITEAWSPIGKGRELLSQQIITDIATAHQATPAQVVIAWHLARGVLPLPKSADARRQRENLAATAIVLNADEVTAITTLGHSGGRLNNLNPETHEEF